MPTILSFLSGRQITNDSGVPQSGAKLYHYREGTLTNLTVWQDAAGTVPHIQPVECDAGGFVPLVYVDDTFDWKVIVKTAAEVTLKTYDELAKAPTEVASVGFAPPLLEWTQVTSGASPVALTVADAGKAYEADTTGSNIEFDLPDAASVGDGRGFFFKKTAAANSMILDPNGAQTIDDVSASLTITAKDTVIGIFSNGAEWYTVIGYGLFRIINSLTEDTLVDPDADFFVTFDASAGVEKKVKPRALTPGTVQATASGTSFDFTGLPAGIRRITMVFDAVSLSGTDNLLVQIGDSGGVSATGYVSASARVTGTNAGDVVAVAEGFNISPAIATAQLSGTLTITRITGNVWVSSHSLGSGTGSTRACHGGGTKTLSGELDRVRLTASGANTFDNGQVNVYFERY